METFREMHAVTGPFSYSGKYISRRLLAEELHVRGLIRRPPTKPVEGISCRALQFADPAALIDDLRGCRVLYNTYWIRFERGGETFAQAVRNIETLATAAREAGVERIVHMSVTKPALDSPFAYFRGKARAEEVIQSIGIPYSILRPTLVFGPEDILINNIAWLLRRLHLFPVPGNGRYRVQPVFVEDVAQLAYAEAMETSNRTLDAAGPEVFAFFDFVNLLRESVGAMALVLRAPVGLTASLGLSLNAIVHDTLITREEIGALVAETLVSDDPPTASTKFSAWLDSFGRQLGASYHSELTRHWRQQ